MHQAGARHIGSAQATMSSYDIVPALAKGHGVGERDWICSGGALRSALAGASHNMGSAQSGLVHATGSVLDGLGKRHAAGAKCEGSDARGWFGTWVDKPMAHGSIHARRS